MLSRLGEQRYAPSQEGGAVEGDAAGGATWGEPPTSLCGHRATGGPWSLTSTALISMSSQPSWEVGIRTLTFELSNGGARTCWGPSHRHSGGRLRFLTPLQAPSSLFQKWTGECLPFGASDLFSGVWALSPTWLLPQMGQRRACALTVSFSWTLPSCMPLTRPIPLFCFLSPHGTYHPLHSIAT